MSVAAVRRLLLGLAAAGCLGVCAAADPLPPSTWSPDGGLTGTGRPGDGAEQRRPEGGWCEGINYDNDNHFDPAFMGGPMVGWNWTPASSVSIGRIEIYTGEVAGTSRVALWSDDGSADPGRPLAPLGFSGPFPTDVPKDWYGADLLTPVDVTAGVRYWIVWDPSGNEQVSASDDPADIQPSYYGSGAGDVEGGAGWSGPFSFPDRRWKARMSCVGACESPELFTGEAVDASACNDGIRLDWDEALFPGAGGGLYHVYRSMVGFADALSQPAVATELALPGWQDTETLPGEVWYYVVQAESTDFPDCGDGPSVLGSTDTLELGPVEDAADVEPPTGDVGNTLRATGYTRDTVDFDWSLAALPMPGEQHRVSRSDDDPAGPFVQRDLTPDQAWTDPGALARPGRARVRYYDVRLVDACGNASRD